MKRDSEKDEKSSGSIYKGVYLLPNLFTTAALFAAFYAIIAAMKWQFAESAIAIFIAMVFDSLDGRVARLTKTTSSFGAEYDSLADMISFGLAPSILMYNWGLHFLGKAGWLMAFCYTASVGLRLARFNLQLIPNKRYFYGLPCPSAAGVIASIVWMQSSYQLSGLFLSTVSGILIIILSILMMSNITYRSFKDSDFIAKVPFLSILFIILLFVSIAIDPPKVLFGMFFIYSMSGPVMALKKLKKIKLIDLKKKFFK